MAVAKPAACIVFFAAAVSILASIPSNAHAQEGYPTNSAEVDAAVARLGDTTRQADDFEKQGRFAEAEPFWRDALAQRKWLLGERSPLVAAGMDRLARNLEAQGSFKQAEPLRRTALDLYEMDTDSAKDRPRAHSSLGYNLTMQGNVSEGAAESYKALEMLRAAGKAEEVDAAKALSVVGLTLDKQGLYAQAEPFYRRALAIRRKALGEDDLDTATSYNNLAAALSGQRRYDEAHMMFIKSMDIRRANGTVPGLVAESALNMALNLDNQKQYVRAERLYRLAIDTWTTLYGAEHVVTASGYNGLGMNFFRQGKLTQAAEQYQHALLLREAALGRFHPDTAESYGNLGITEIGLGHKEKGRALLTIALEINERLLGPSHPDTQQVRSMLGVQEAGAVPSPTIPAKQELSPMDISGLPVRDVARHRR
ncbi:hypothetical protein V474_13995 [Novosphingobium barchaimii LL02]|uniref:Uncharacterized protein n=1 Tax=Novosphingobium barchaimii LL02 TaxID=1114963 RepID=A0A0J7XYK6_9SPHN|nr:tetratricopeptide repeat protein [Novosphingobium barchaimii]KMS56619.1 hypothetical protein V474_13995 [Novosphingobium barchaimii LL02]